MKNSNIIISVIIVLCIAGAVTAYGLVNPEDNIFTNLAGFTPAEDSATDNGVEDTGNGGSGDNGPNMGGSSNGGSGSNGGSASGISSSEAKNMVNNKYIAQEGYYAGDPKLIDGNWCVPVLDNEGNIKGEIWIDAKTGENLGGAGGAD